MRDVGARNEAVGLKPDKREAYTRVTTELRRLVEDARGRPRGVQVGDESG